MKLSISLTYWVFQQVGLYFFSIKGSFVSFAKMVIIGVKKRMEELLGKHMNDSRFVIDA